MSLRRAAVLAVPIALAACTKVTQEPNPPDLVFARYSSPNVPTPNDLALAAIPAAPCTALPNAQAQLLCTFKNAGGFPSDQEVSISIPFTAYQWDAAAPPYGAYREVAAPAIDLASVTASTLTVLEVNGTTVTPVAVEAAASAPGSCATTPCTPATLTVRKAAVAGSRRWTPGARYVIGVRGGASGVKTTPDGLPVQADSAIALVLPNKDLSIPENQPLGRVPDSNGNGTNADEVGSLEALRAALWAPVTWGNAGGVWHPTLVDPASTVTAFAAIDTVFPYGETAAAATFTAAPLPNPVVVMDSGSGAMPFPSDFLLGANGKVRDLSSILCNPGVTGCDTALAISSLDGFSTTAPATFNTSAAVKAGALPANSVFLFDLGPIGAPLAVPVLLTDLAQASTPAQVGAASYAGKVAGTTVALAPAIPVDLGGGAYRHLPPLQEKRQYAVVVTDKLLAAGDVPFARNTINKILWSMTAPLFAGGKSQVPGVADADAAGLQALRTGLDPVLTTALPAFTGGAVTKANVVAAYTIRTQSVTAGSVSMSAAPYQAIPAAAAPTVTAALTPAQLEAAKGFPAAYLPGVQQVLLGKFNSVDPVAPNGLLNPNPAQWAAASLDYLAAVPANAACTAAAPCAAPVVIFHHGLGGSRYQMLPFAAALAAKGFVTVAIDAPFHGDRAFCDSDDDCVAAGGGAGTCTATPATPASPAHCAAGETLKFDAAGLSTQASANYFVSGNFFRTRDAIRHDLLDQSALVLAVAPPAARAAGSDPFASALLAAGYVVDPTKVYFAGQSLGAIIGTSVLATNPRISRGVLNVGGGTVVDVFTTSAAFTAQPTGPGSSRLEKAINDVLPGFTLQAAQTDPVVGAKYQQLLLLAKWILDPADPINYAASARTKLASPLDAPAPAGLGGTPLHFATTDVYTQMAKGDLVVPNATNLQLDTLIGAAPTLYQTAAAGDVDHGYLISGGPAALTGNPMQTHASSYLFDLTVPATPAAIP